MLSMFKKKSETDKTIEKLIALCKEGLSVARTCNGDLFSPPTVEDWVKLKSLTQNIINAQIQMEKAWNNAAKVATPTRGDNIKHSMATEYVKKFIEQAGKKSQLKVAVENLISTTTAELLPVIDQNIMEMQNRLNDLKKPHIY